MSAFKFSEGDRVVVQAGVFYNHSELAGVVGTVVQVWPKAGLLNANQYQVLVEAPVGGHLVFDENQLDHDVLGKLASL